MSEKYVMNMQVLKKSNKDPKSGDIFMFQLKNTQPIFGRVINADVQGGGFPGILVYIFKNLSLEELLKGALPQLLMPPIIVNKRLWTMGYFEKIDHKELEKDEVLQAHCFKKVHPVDDSKISYVNEYGEKIPKKINPCGSYGLVGFMGVDKMVTKALEE